MENVSLTISQDIVKPIVQAKINEAIIAAMGGADDLISKVVGNVLNSKVNSEGKVSSYSSENKFNWIDIAVTKQIEDATRLAINELLSLRRDKIKEALKKQLLSKKGIEQFAEALLDQTTKITERYHSNIKIEFSCK